MKTMESLLLMAISFVVFPLFFAGAVHAAPKLTEDQKIEALFTAIQTSNAVFVRNGEDHPAAEAVVHLRKKLDMAAHSIFAPKRSAWTAKMFIDKIASKSSLSGEIYLVRLPNKRLCQAGVWLNEQLAIIESRN
ncbi:YfeK family protein [soil metagenome]